MKKQEDSDKKDPKPSTSGQGGAAASSGGDFGDAEQYQELNPIGTGRFPFKLFFIICCLGRVGVVTEVTKFSYNSISIHPPLTDPK